MSEGTQLLAEGEPIAIGDRKVTLRYGMRSLLMLEEKFGSLDKLDIDPNNGEPFIGPALKLIACGLLHENRDGAPYTESLLVDLIEFADFQELLNAAGRALRNAFPTQTAPESEEAVPSPGLTGTTSAPSSADAAMSGSGG